MKKNYSKQTVTQKTKIRPIWSPWTQNLHTYLQKNVLKIQRIFTTFEMIKVEQMELWGNYGKALIKIKY
jgi:hypothetical protein